MKQNYKNTNQNNPIIRLLLLLLLLGGVSLSGWGQTTIHYWSFNVDTNSELDASTNTPTSIPADIGNGVINHDLSFSTFGGSDLNLELGFDAGVALCPEGAGNNGKAFVVVLSTEGYENINFSFAARRTTAGYNNNKIEVSSDGGDTWELVIDELLFPSSFALHTYDLSAIDSDVDDNEEVWVKVTLDVAGSVTGGGNNRYDNIKITGDPLAPTASILSRPTHIDLSSETSESAVLIQLNNYTSDDVRYRLFSGENQYDLWNSETETYISSSDYSDNPKVPGTPTDESVFWAIFQRGTNNSTSATYRDRLGPNYDENNLDAILPQATSIDNPHQIEDADVNFSHNDYDDKHVVLAFDQNEGGTLISAASTSLNNGEFSIVVPDDVIIKRLELRDAENNLLESQTGVWTGIESGWQITQAGQTYTIDFDNTVVGVNNDQFTGGGFNPEPAAGQLNSNAWAATGFREEDMDFGDTRESDDYNRGTNPGTTGTAGIWAFEVEENNHALGIKPGGSTFTPGYITLRMQNQTGSELTSISFSYIVYIKNNQDRGNTFNFSHSADNQSFIQVDELDLTSEEGQDADPEWKAYYRTGKITGLNVPLNGFYYFRWNGNDDGGSGSRDAFALDDITIVANPTEPLAVEGAFEELVLANTAEVAIAPNNNLTVNGEFVNNAGNSGLIIESDATGTGSFIHHTSSVQATVERYIEAAPNWPDDKDKDDGARGWHFLSAPVSEMTIIGSDFVPNPNGGTLPSNFDFYAFNESEDLPWINIRGEGGVPNDSFENTFVPGKGYLVAYESTVTNKFIGELNVGNISIPLSHGDLAGKHDWYGWNLLGNPYASAIDWRAAVHTPFINNFAYIYDRNEGVGGNYVTIDGDSQSTRWIIPAHQGFFVLADENAEDFNFTFTNDMRVHGDDFMKDQPVSEHIRLRITKDDFYSDTRIRIHKEAQHGTDRYDAHKLFSLNPNMPQVYSYTEDNTRVAVNSVPEITDETVFLLGIRIPAEGEYTISLQELTGAFATESIYLTDLLLDKTVELGMNMAYTFTATPDDDANRFLLHFSPIDDSTNIEEIDETNIQLWFSNNTLFVNSHEHNTAVEVYDISGRRLQSHQLNAGEHRLDLNLPAGVYIVQSSGNSHHETMKIIIQ